MKTNEKIVTYIVFKRFTIKISGKDEWRFYIQSFKFSYKQAEGFITNLVEQSKIDKAFLNVYTLNDYGLYKVCFIKKGELYTF